MVQNAASPFSPIVTLGPCRDIFLIGGGEILLHTAAIALDLGYAVRVVTSPRQADETINGENFCDFLNKRKIACLVAEKINAAEVKEFINYSDSTFYLSLSAGWIFKNNIITELFRNRLFNIHGSRLPQYKGGGGSSWQILTANRFGGFTLHMVDSGIDTGPVAAYKEFLFPATCRIPLDFARFSFKAYASFVSELLESFRDCRRDFQLQLQRESFSSYFPRLSTPINAWIDWSLSAEEIERFICAFDSPYQGAQTFCNGKKVHIKSVSMNLQDGIFHSFQSGIVYRKAESWICVCARGAALVIEDVTNEYGASAMNDISLGDRFTTPYEYLESSKIRVIYTSSGMKIRGNRSQGIEKV